MSLDKVKPGRRLTFLEDEADRFYMAPLSLKTGPGKPPSRDELVSRLQEINKARCDPPLSASEVEEIGIAYFRFREVLSGKADT
jgi:hypothetical protein